MKMDMTLNQWAESLQEEVYEWWKENHSDYERGFRVFGSPVVPNPEILFLGFQPGGGKSDFNEYELKKFKNGDFTLPTTHEYISQPYPQAKTMGQAVFEDNTEFLENTIKSNVIFFRAEGTDDWKTVSKERRKQLQQYSLSKVDQIVDKVEPNTIFAEGIDTWNILKSRYDFTGECIARTDDHRVAFIAEESQPRFAGMVHPSYRGSTDEDWKIVRNELLPRLGY